MTIEELYNRAKAIDIEQVVNETMQDQKENLIFLNQYQLYNESEDADGEPLEFYKSIGYALLKNKRNPNLGYGRPDLYDTGDFYKGFRVKITRTTFDIDSNDEKSGMLKEKYGDKIFGLSEKHLEEFSGSFFNEAFINKLQNKLK